MWSAPSRRTTRLSCLQLEGRELPAVAIAPRLDRLGAAPLADVTPAVVTPPAAPQAAASSGWFGVDPAADGVYAKPYRYVGTVYTFWKNGEIKQGTGFMVGRSHVVTAGHVLYNQATRQSPVTVMFTPGEYYGKAPVGSANAVKWAVAKPFLDGNKYFDYGVMKLNRPLGDRTLGWFAMERWAAGTSSQNVMIAGYTVGWNQARSQLRGSGSAYESFNWDPRSGGVRWSMDGMQPLGGLSGSPLIVNRNGVWRVVGIYTSGEGSGIGGVKLTQAVTTDLQNWVNQNP